MITAVVLTNNDEQTILKTLESVVWCDEVVAVDDCSTDATVSLIKKTKATIFSRDLHGDFSAQRNFGLSKAKGDWVLFVDSDEVVSEELRKEIIKVISHQSSVISNCVGFYIKRNDWMWGRELKHGETSNVRLLRLAKKGSGEWKDPVHEIWDVKGETATFTNPLLHYPHPSVAQFLDQIHIYSTLRAKYLFDAKTPVYGWHVVAYPVAKFLQNYVIRLGFLDGMPGIIVAMMMSFHSFLVRSKLYLLYYKKSVPYEALS